MEKSAAGSAAPDATDAVMSVGNVFKFHSILVSVAAATEMHTDRQVQAFIQQCLLTVAVADHQHRFILLWAQ